MLRILVLSWLFIIAPISQATTLLVLGDSLSAAYGIAPERGWVALLDKRLQQQGYAVSVVNASISGETTQGGLSRLPRLLEQHQPDIVLLELGANDGLRGTFPPVIRSNLNRLTQLSKQQGARVLVLGMQLPPNYGPAYTRRFAEVFTGVAETHDTALVPFFMEKVALEPSLMQGDGLHPNAAGQPFLLDTVWPALVPLLPRP
ncbi:arylesterase [Pontibacterium granulatum]|uniref:arylesterase n=1 Tax=Pontibacterium granulatum TaxID=2036029 RepID=UPI00249B5241|nr:arylesterase [Pontibacterium granulatum]MDI3325109.1 arylesterase [Pontibacterium granulatum]